MITVMNLIKSKANLVSAELAKNIHGSYTEVYWLWCIGKISPYFYVDYIRIECCTGNSKLVEAKAYDNISVLSTSVLDLVKCKI